jgi:nucleoside-diphosphate-sugar epimerase
MTVTVKLSTMVMLLISLLLFMMVEISSLNLKMSTPSKNVLIVGGTRFSGLYLWRELHKRGHKITLFNRGITEIVKLPSETDDEFIDRKQQARYIKGDRTVANDLEQLKTESFDVIYDINGRTVADTAPLADMFKGKVEHFVYMSCAGVYKKSATMPHFEGDTEDENGGHKGKLDTEAYLRESGLPFTSIRPSYIYGPLNYSPLEEYVFARLQKKRKICIPGHGQHIAGLGHVEDLAVAMAQVIGREHAKGQVYNIQDQQSVTFESLCALCCQAMGKDPKKDMKIKIYPNSMFDFGSKKAFPMEAQHLFCSVDKAMTDLDWTPKYTMLAGLTDSYENDFKVKVASKTLQVDFTLDDQIIDDDRAAVVVWDGSPSDDIVSLGFKFP